MKRTRWEQSVMFLLCLVGFSAGQSYNWQPRPEKADMMVFLAHPDDEGYCGGAIPYYTIVKQKKIVIIMVTSGGGSSNYWSQDWDAMHRMEAIREEEMRCAVWKYGMRWEPVFLRYPNCCLSRGDALVEWGGLDSVAGRLCGLVRRYRPEVVMTLDFNGEYGHGDHIGVAIASTTACDAAGDPRKYPGQLDSVGVWTPKKVYVHYYEQNRLSMTGLERLWKTPFPEMGGRTPEEVANEGLACHESQGYEPITFGEKEGDDCRPWGLYRTTVGLDAPGSTDFFQNIPTTAVVGDGRGVGALGLRGGLQEGVMGFYTVSGRAVWRGGRGGAGQHTRDGKALRAGVYVCRDAIVGSTGLLAVGR